MEPQLLAALVIGVAIIFLLVLRTRLDAFIALVTAALATGLIAGVPVAEVVDMVTTGFGNTLANIGMVIGLGVMIGKLLEVSGGADALAAAFRGWRARAARTSAWPAPGSWSRSPCSATPATSSCTRWRARSRAAPGGRS